MVNCRLTHFLKMGHHIKYNMFIQIKIGSGSLDVNECVEICIFCSHLAPMTANNVPASTVPLTVEETN